VEGWPGDRGNASWSAPDQVDSLSSHPGDEEGRRRRGVVPLVLVVALVLGIGAASSLRGRSPEWPTGCGLEGHADWCAKPSRAMTDGALRRIVRDYCPGLSKVRPRDVVPRPIDLVDLGGRGAYARTSGSKGAGTEDSLLGRGPHFSWVTRWSGGDQDGVVELRCPGQTVTVPSVRLDADQFWSTVAARRGRPRTIDFAQLASSSVRRVPHGFRVSFGFLNCDTTGLDLRHLRTGKRFSCALEVYSGLGKGGYRIGYRTTARPPYVLRTTTP